MKTIRNSVTLLLGALLIGCSPESDNQDMLTEYPNQDLLVSVEWLEEHKNDPDLHIIDMRPEGYEDGFIPGAVHIEGADELVDPDHEFEAYLIGAERFEALMQEHGVSNDSRVVIYDNGNSLHAARLFYAMELYGTSAHILNGGITAWQNITGELADSTADVPAGDFQAEKQEERYCDLSYLQDNLDSDDVVVFDVRSEEERRGEDVRSERGGHIPQSVHLEWSHFIEQEGIPYFRPAADIQRTLQTLGITQDKEVIPHCQSNVRGSHAYFTLRLMGYDEIRPYEGSWAEYGNRDDVQIQ